MSTLWQMKAVTIATLLVWSFTTLAIPVTALTVHAAGTNTTSHVSTADANDKNDFEFESTISYSDYVKQYEDAASPDQTITLEAEQYSRSEGQTIERMTDYEQMPGISILTSDQGEVEWEFHVKQAGLYHLSVQYYPIEGKSSSIERALRIDGEIPFKEAGYLQFERIWDNESQHIRMDNQGNELRPQQIERPTWQEEVIKDADGYYNEPFQFYLSEGDHTLSLVSEREPMVVRQLKIYQAEAAVPYTELLQQYKANSYKPTSGVLMKVEGEHAIAKSSPTLYPLSERSSPAVAPYSSSKIKMNTIGGNNWRIPGQWVEWSLDISEAGLYTIGFKAKQNFVRGMYSTRILTIDGKVPFQEMEQVPFRYKSGYRIDMMGGDEPYLYYLGQGNHVLRLEVTLGEFTPLIREVEESLMGLNSMYRKILMITGTAPDKVRDYQVDRKIPNLLEVFQDERERLNRISEQLKAISGQSSDQVALLHTMVVQLDEMIDRPDTIPSRLDAYKANTGGLGTWLQKAREQPLQIDSVYVLSPDQEVPAAGMGFFAKLWHEIQTFFYSFFIDYNQIGDVSNEAEGQKHQQRSVTVWIGSGRDQANTMKAMIDDTFTADTGIQVNLKLVQMNTLLPATLAGQGPDVAMQISNDLPVNYAMRKAAVDLTQFRDYEQVSTRFRSSSLVPYTFEQGVYALPETQTFNMLFYRKDVLKELGLEIPQTWDDVSNTLAVLNKNHMEFGLPLVLVPSYPGENIPPNSVFAALLFQNGGSFYTEGSKASALDTRIGIETFKTWIEFYTDYKLEKEFDFANRFRTGQMPIGIADYTIYNQLTVFAPEIRGLWGFAPMPGMEADDGTIHREVPSGGSGVLMLNNAKDKEAAWEFMKWWTSEDTQTAFGREMEGLMGAAARYPTANIQALDQLPWPVEDYNNLQAQFEWVRGLPEVPGGYFTGRHLLNAFYQVINNNVEPREAIVDYVQYIHDEIRTKRHEFGLPE